MLNEEKTSDSFHDFTWVLERNLSSVTRELLCRGLNIVRLEKNTFNPWLYKEACNNVKEDTLDNRNWEGRKGMMEDAQQN